MEQPVYMDEEGCERIARRAYEIYLSRAGVDEAGSAEEDWQQAEEEINRALGNISMSTESDPD